MVNITIEVMMWWKVAIMISYSYGDDSNSGVGTCGDDDSDVTQSMHVI